MSIDITPQQFEAVVRDWAERNYRALEVSGFTVSVPKRTRRTRTDYKVHLVYDPVEDHWSGHGEYRGGLTTNALHFDLRDALKAAGYPVR
jgi:hypothetical protein